MDWPRSHSWRYSRAKLTLLRVPNSSKPVAISWYVAPTVALSSTPLSLSPAVQSRSASRTDSSFPPLTVITIVLPSLKSLERWFMISIKKSSIRNYWNKVANHLFVVDSKISGMIIGNQQLSYIIHHWILWSCRSIIFLKFFIYFKMEAAYLTGSPRKFSCFAVLPILVSWSAPPSMDENKPRKLNHLQGPFLIPLLK